MSQQPHHSSDGRPAAHSRPPHGRSQQQNSLDRSTQGGAHGTAPVVVKIGGRIAADAAALNPILLGLGERAYRGAPTILVHGGGDEVTTFSRRLGLEPRFEDGVRITTADEMPIVEMVLAGSANTALVRKLQSTGVPSVGLTGCDGATIIAEAVHDRDAKPTSTGRVKRVNAELPLALMGAHYLPVIASVAMSVGGVPLNINADEVAFAIAKAVQAEALVFVADTDGITKHGARVPVLTPEQVEHEIAAGVIEGGMVVKARAAVDALAGGVSRIMVGSCDSPAGFTALITGSGGTRIAYE